VRVAPLVRRRGDREDRRDASAHRSRTLEFAPERDLNQEGGPIATRSVFDERKENRASLEEHVATVLEARGQKNVSGTENGFLHQCDRNGFLTYYIYYISF